MPSQKDTIISRLQKHAGEWFTNIPQFKGSILCAHYFSLPNHRGGVMRPAEQFVTQDDEVITIKDVPVSKLVSSVESSIKSRVPEDRRTEIYHKVLRGMPGHKAVPGWDLVSKESIYANPLTPFSMPRDENISNQDLLDALAPAAEMTLSAAESIGIQISWWDAMSGGKAGAMMSFGDGVTGGRLGDNHKHTISDVPRNYFRDKLMDYINVQLDRPEDVKQAARKAICPDLTDSEIEEYTGLIAEDRKKIDAKAEAGSSAERPSPTREDLARQILQANSDISTMAQATKIVLMREALEGIDDEIDWHTPKPTGIRRSRATEVTGSVLLPHSFRTRLESDFVPDDEIDRDCDQVRAMIKKLVAFQNSWDIDSFRLALGSNMTRDRLLTFLNKRGTDAAQKKSAAYLLSWEFFNRRQKMGLSVEDADSRQDFETVQKKRKDEQRSERERALVAVYRQKKKALENRMDSEVDALGKIHGEKVIALKSEHLEELKALVQAHPVGSPDYPDKVRELADKQRKEDQAQNKEHEEERSAQGTAQRNELTAFREERKREKEALREKERLEALRVKEQVEALAVSRPGRLNTGKRASRGASGGRGKRARK